ncbi:MAG: ABC transporter permease [Oligosphaeraceae bacterium]
MKAFHAILKQTVRSALRSKVFLVLFALILLCVIGLPLTIRGDNTAAGLIQVSLTYSLNLVIALVSASCLWLGCSLLSSEIEGYQVHMAVTKPCPRWKLWTGKFVGVFLMHAVILVVSMVLIYGLTFYRLRAAHASGLFSDSDMARLQREFLVARRQFRPAMPDLRDKVTEEYEKRVKQGLVDARMDELAVKRQIMQELASAMMRNIVVKPGEEHTWEFKDVRIPAGADVRLCLRFRMYSNDSLTTDQRMIPLDFGFQYKGAVQGVTGRPTVWYTEGPEGARAPFVMPGGSWQEINTLTSQEEALLATEGIKEGVFPLKAADVVDAEGKSPVVLTIRNLGDLLLPPAEAIPPDEESQKEYQRQVRNSTAVFQVADGPTLLCPVASFPQNYFRTMLMALFQLAFLAALGSTVGALFSTPVAVFVAVAYLIIGLVVPAALNAPLRGDDGRFMYANVWEKAAHLMAQGVQTLVVTVDDLNTTGDLAAGKLVELHELGWAFLKVLVVRSGLLAFLGIFFLTRRELGLVVRRNT